MDSSTGLDSEVTYRGVVYPWDCDHMGHMNVMRYVGKFDEATWIRKRFPLVVEGNLAKFAQNPQLKDFLLGTGDRVLVEASPYDRIWGIGLAADDSAAENPALWKGLNLLGFALMEVRERLRGPG